MRGSIRARGDGYEISVSAGIDPVSGHRRRLYRHARTKREAERELTRLLAEVDAGSFADPGRLTVAAYMRDRWLPHQRTRLRDRTWRRYEGLLDRHILPAIGSVPMAKLRPAHVQAVVDAMTGAGLAPRTVVQGYRVLSSALRQAVRWQLLGSNPAAAASPPRPERARLSIPDADAVSRIIAASGSDWFHVAVVLAASSGMRRGEVLGLCWQDVDLDGGLVRISSALEPVGDELVLVDPKTSRARRPIELPDGTMSMLRRLRRTRLSAACCSARPGTTSGWSSNAATVGRSILTCTPVGLRGWFSGSGSRPSASTTYDMPTRPDCSRRTCIRRSLRICSAMRPRASPWTPTRMWSRRSGRVPLLLSRQRSAARSGSERT
jgi:integrase